MKSLEETYTWPELADHTIQQAKNAGIGINSNRFRRYVMELEKVGSRFDFAMKARCFVIREKLKNDYDHVMVITSKEGWGKSTLAIQIATAINPDWDLSFCAFTLEEIITAMKRGKAGDVLIIDEGSLNMFSRESMSKGNRILAKLFMIARQKNMCIIICIPNFHLLDSYIRDHRCDTLIAKKSRSRYICYTGRAIRRVSMIGHKFKEIIGIRVANGTFFEGTNRGLFPKTVDVEEYLKRKEEHMKGFLDDLEEEKNVEFKFIPAKQMAQVFDCDVNVIRQRIIKGNIPGQKIMNRWYVNKEFYEENAKTLQMGQNA